MPCAILMSATNSVAMTAYSRSSGVLIEGCPLPLWVHPLSHWIGGVVDRLFRIVGRS